MIHSLPAGPLLEHELLRGVDGPVVPLARPAQRLGQLDEALVEAEVVAHRVLPALVGCRGDIIPVLDLYPDLDFRYFFKML